MAAQRLDKIIASTGRWSRREVKDLVRQGRVTVDDVPARSAEEKADPEQAVIAVNGEKLNWRRYTWVMLNKPVATVPRPEMVKTSSTGIRKGISALRSGVGI